MNKTKTLKIVKFTCNPEVRGCDFLILEEKWAGEYREIYLTKREAKAFYKFLGEIFKLTGEVDCDCFPTTCIGKHNKQGKRNILNCKKCKGTGKLKREQE